MQSGDLVDTAVVARTTRITVNGVPRGGAWEKSQELSTVGDRIIAGDGLQQASGWIDWDLPSAPSSPWNGAWVPSPGDRIVIWQGDGVSEWQVFTGVADYTTGDMAGGFRTRVIDDSDKLSARIRHQPMMAVMSPRNAGGTPRGTGLVHTYYVDLAMRAAGFYCTPPNDPGVVVHIPCQGGTWPHVNEPVIARTVSGGSYPSNHWAPWGYAVSNMHHTYVPEASRPASDPVQMTVLVAPDHAGFFYMRLGYGSTYLQLSVNANRQVSAHVGTSIVAQISLTGDAVVQMFVHNGRVQLRASTGQSQSVTAPFSGSTPLGQVTVEAREGSRVAGIQVSHPPSGREFEAQSFTPTARIATANNPLVGIPRAIPKIDQSASNLLADIARSTLSFCWINELGVMQWWPAPAMLAKPSTDAIATSTDVYSGGWAHSLLDTASRVTVAYKNPAIRYSINPTVELWRGPGAELGGDEVVETAIGPAADEAWFQVDTSFEMVGPNKWGPINNNIGSKAGGYFDRGTGEGAAGNGEYYSASIWRGGLDRWWVREVTSQFQPGTSHVAKTSATNTDVWQRHRNENLPIVRGFAHVEWVDEEYVPTQASGSGPEYEHDGSYWVPFDVADNWSDFLIAQMAQPAPYLTGLEVTPDPRRQLGDVVTITSPQLLGAALRCLIVGMSTAHDENGATQSLSVRVISASVSGQTYQAWNAGQQLAYSQLTGDQSYSAFNTDMEA